MLRRLCFIAFIGLTFAGCGSSSSSTTTPTTTFHGEVTDPVGDASPGTQLANPPDLVRATIDVASGTMTVSVRCAPGTFNRDTTAILIEFDTDQSAATGQRGSTSDFGYDYIVSWTINGQPANVTRVVGTDANFATAPVGPAPVILSADGVDIAVPLSMLGNDDGRVSFRVLASDRPSLKTADAMPDENLSPARVQ